MSLALSGLTACNWEEEGNQEVIVLVDGDPGRIAAFRKMFEERNSHSVLSFFLTLANWSLTVSGKNRSYG